MDNKSQRFINEVNRERKYGNYKAEFLTEVYQYLRNEKEIEDMDEVELLYGKLYSAEEFSTLSPENLAQLLKVLMYNSYM
jgi:hypothetical protein